MGDIFQRVFDGVGKRVHRVNAPGVPGVVVRGVAYAVDRWVAHIDVRRGHVNFGAQHRAAVWQLACAHVSKALQVVLN